MISVQLLIYYCEESNYEPYARKLRDALKKHWPTGLTILVERGGPGQFDVILKDNNPSGEINYLWRRHDSGRIPEHREIIDKIEAQEEIEDIAFNN